MYFPLGQAAVAFAFIPNEMEAGISGSLESVAGKRTRPTI